MLKFLSFPLYTVPQVTANDADVDRPNNIIYFLTGPGINAENPSESNFDINKATGEIFVLKVSFACEIIKPRCLDGGVFANM